MRRAALFGTSLPAQRKGAVAAARRPLPAVCAAKQIPVEIEKPIGLGLKESKAKGGGLVVTVSAVLKSGPGFTTWGCHPCWEAVACPSCVPFASRPGPQLWCGS